jgi:hypothetical protein
MPLAESNRQPQALNPLFTQGDDKDSLSLDGDNNSFGGDNCNLDDDDSVNDDDQPLSSLGPNGSTEGRLTYQFVVEKAQNLVRLAQSDPIKLGSLCNLFDQLSDRLRKGHTIDVGAFDLALPSAVDKENLANRPVQGTLKPTATASKQNRKKTSIELRRTIASAASKKKSLLPGHSNDLSVCAAPRTKKKACTICRQPKHQRGSCPKITKFKRAALEMGKSLITRFELSTALGNQARYITHNRPKDNILVVSSSVPT